jgi:hypothetical protein
VEPIVPARRTLCFAARGGTGDLEDVTAPFSWEVTIAGSGDGARIDDEGCYTAGDGVGVDIVRLEDRLTGQLLQVAVTVVDRAEITVGTPRVLMIAGDAFDVEVRGGTGEYDFEFEGDEVTGTELLRVEGAPATLRLLAGPSAGTDFVRVRDAHFPDIVGHLDVGVMSTVHHEPSPYGAHGDDMDVQAIGDVNGDGFPDFAAGSSQAGINSSYSGSVYIYLGNGAGFDTEPAQIISGYRRYDRLGRQFASGDFNSDGCGDLAIGVWGEPLAGSERGEVRVYTGCNEDEAPEGDEDWNHRLADNLPTPAGVVPLALYDRIQGGQANQDRLGFAVTAGDFDGDGTDDIAATAYQAETQVWIDPNDDRPFNNLGRAYIFLQRDEGFSDLANIFIDGVFLTPEGEYAGRDNNYFGYDLWAADLNGDPCADLVVGSGRADNSHGYASVYLSVQSEDAPSGCELATLPAVTFNPSTQDRSRAGRLGYVVRAGDFNGDCVNDVVVNQYTAGSNGNNGRFLVFLNQGWSADTPQHLTTDDAAASFTADRDDQFAFSLAVGDVNGDGNDDILASGRYAEHETTVPNVSEVRVFLGNIDGERCNGWDGESPLFADPEIGPGAQYIGFFGQRLAVVPDADGDGIDDVVQFAERGTTDDDFVDHLGSVLWRPSAAPGWDYANWERLSRPDVEHDDHLGWRTESVGDVNDDGFDDFLATADGFDLELTRTGYIDTQSNAGSAYLFFGARDGIGDVPDMEISGSASHSGFDRFGHSADGVGDFNGDGIDDFAVAAPFDDNNGICVACRDGAYRSDPGSVFIYFGRVGLGTRRGPDDPMARLVDPDYVICGPQRSSVRIGREVSGGGDVNGDGLGDIVMSNWNAEGARGTVYIAYGSPGQEDGPGVHCMERDDAGIGTADGGGDLLGYGLGSADLDGDGCAEIIAGAPNDDFVGRGNAGAIHVWRGFGGPGCPEQTSRVVFVGDRAGDNIGYRLTVLGDLNDDGVPEVAAGSSGYGVTNFGAVLVVDGGRMGQALAVAEDGQEVPLTADYYYARLITPAQATGTGFGYDLDTLGDVNGDGRPDLIVGERYYSQGDVLRRGAAWVYLSDETVEAYAQPDLVIPGSAKLSNGDFGAAVTGGAVGATTVIMVGAWIAEWEGPEMGEMGEVYVGHVNFRRR